MKDDIKYLWKKYTFILFCKFFGWYEKIDYLSIIKNEPKDYSKFSYMKFLRDSLDNFKSLNIELQHTNKNLKQEIFELERKLGIVPKESKISQCRSSSMLNKLNLDDFYKNKDNVSETDKLLDDWFETAE